MTIKQADKKNKIAILRGRKAHLAYQGVSEKQLWRVYKKAAGKIGTKIMLEDAPIPKAKLRALLNSVESEIKRLDSKVLASIERAINKSVKMGIDNSIDRLSIYKGFMSATYIIKPTSSVLNSIYTDAVRALYRRPLDGIELSARVWDVHNITITEIRRIIAKGYLYGEPSYSIAQQVRRMLLISDSDMRTKKWKAFFKEHPPGRGVYKSAYKNTQRIIRTETNNAFRLAQSEYAKSRTWIIGEKWHRVAGAIECGECLIAGTEIVTLKGSKNIEDIKAGDRVLTHKKKWQKVMKTFVYTTQEKYLVKLSFQVEKNHIQELIMTRSHPVLTEKGWIRADDLQMGYHGFYYFSKNPETSSPFPHDDVCRQELDFVENETLLHEQKDVEGLNDVMLNQLKNNKDIYILNFLMPNLKHMFACAVFLGYLKYHFSNLDFESLCEIQKKIDESRNYDISQVVFLLVSSLMLHNVLNNIFVYYNKKQIFYHNSDKFWERKHSILFDMLWNRTYDFHNFLNNILFYKQGKYDNYLFFDFQQNNNCYKNEALNNDQDDHDKTVSMEFPSRNIHNILSCFNNSINGRACPGAKLIKKDYIKTDNRKVYNLEIENDNSYIANGIVVHNCDTYATQDLYGLGSGVYPGGEIPISHPQCLCFLTDVIRRDILKSGATATVAKST